uniref:Uncharacterized protein n=1 Tax=Anguilla anguilla TaxID=7936 RepID=A0A0E9TR82_ANGAN
MLTESLEEGKVIFKKKAKCLTHNVTGWQS